MCMCVGTVDGMRDEKIETDWTERKRIEEVVKASKTEAETAGWYNAEVAKTGEKHPGLVRMGWECVMCCVWLVLAVDPGWPGSRGVSLWACSRW